MGRWGRLVDAMAKASNAGAFGLCAKPGFCVVPEENGSMRVLNVGSINMDWVYRVAKVVEPGQTVCSQSMQRLPGGKGANQSVAVACAGAAVWHVGCVGVDGIWLIEEMAKAGVDTQWVQTLAGYATGHAFLQIDDEGQNAILIHPGANAQIGLSLIEQAMAGFGAGDWLLLQNETNAGADVVRQAKARGMSVAINLAPVTPQALGMLSVGCDLLIVNEHEADGLWAMHAKAQSHGVKWPGGEWAGDGPVEASCLARWLSEAFGCNVVLTLGDLGALHVGPHGLTRVAAHPVQPVDTTGAGDTFVGYFVAGLVQKLPLAANLDRASLAAAWCCTKAGAMGAIPPVAQLEQQLPGKQASQSTSIGQGTAEPVA